MNKAVGVILAGGLATRMGGGDKGRLPLGKTSLIEHVVARLSSQTDCIALNANGDPKRFDDLNLPVLCDSVPDHPGPLVGILAGLDWAFQQDATHVVSVAADTPFFPIDLVLRLQRAAQKSPVGLALAASQSKTGKMWRQPTFGYWPVALREDLRSALGQGVRKVVQWTDQHQAGQAVFDATVYDPFFNVNTPQDHAKAQAMVGKVS